MKVIIHKTGGFEMAINLFTLRFCGLQFDYTLANVMLADENIRLELKGRHLKASRE